MIRLFLTILILSSCSARWHVNQAIKKGLKVGTDTVYQEKTVIVPGDSTTVFLPVVKDSLITVYQDRIKIQYYQRYDTVRIAVECPSDTVKIEVPISVTTEIDCPPPNRMWRTVAFVLMGLLALLVYIVARR